jgi:vacuolar-type H+-ATPase subunit H
MNIYSLLDELDNMVDNAWNLPLTGGKAALDADQVREVIEDIRKCIPQEVRQARAIANDRRQILDDAKRESEIIIKRAHERAKDLISRDEIVKEAKREADSILKKASEQSAEIHKATNNYVSGLLKNVDDGLTTSLAEFRKVRQNIKSSQK